MTRFRERLQPHARTLFLTTALSCLALCLPPAESPPPRAAENARPAERFRLRRGDHICLIGNTLADRMQHDGWLETYLYSRFPTHDLTIRNLGFSGDELTLRLRSQSFGTPDQWLAGSASVPEPGRLFSRIAVRENRFETTNT